MTGKILLVEDDQNDELLTIRALKKSNLKNEIEVVRDGEEAMNYLQALTDSSNQELPDLILLDLNLPKFSGLDVLSFIKSKKRADGNSGRNSYNIHPRERLRESVFTWCKFIYSETSRYSGFYDSHSKARGVLVRY